MKEYLLFVDILLKVIHYGHTLSSALNLIDKNKNKRLNLKCILLLCTYKYSSVVFISLFHFIILHIQIFLFLSNMSFHQLEHPLLVIPGPIEVSDDVLFANATPSQSHMSKSFTETFGAAIKMFRQVLVTERGQPFIVAGSGTLGWDMVASNLTEPRDEALVLHSGYFGQSFADCFEAYGIKVTQLKAPVGQCPTREQISEALKSKKYKVITVTHVDTSTGVLSNPQMVAEVVREISPDTLVVLDGVCSVGSEEIRMDEWGLDVVMCASQKGLGVPPGLSLVCASERAIQLVETRKTRINTYFASWLNWLPGKFD